MVWVLWVHLVTTLCLPNDCLPAKHSALRLPLTYVTQAECELRRETLDADWPSGVEHFDGMSLVRARYLECVLEDATS